MEIVISIIALIIAVTALLKRREDGGLCKRVERLEVAVSRLWQIERLIQKIKKKRNEGVGCDRNQ